MEKGSDYGIVYLLTNEAMPGLVKIGKTSLTAITKQLLDKDHAVQPKPWWTTVSGESLLKIRLDNFKWD